MKSFLLLVFLLSFAFAQQSIIGTFGSSVSIRANTLTTISFGLLGSNPSLVIQTDANANVTFSLYSNAATNLPSGYSLLSGLTLFSGAVGFTFTVSPSTVNIVSASFTTGALGAQIATQIAANARAGCLLLDTNTNTYQDITVNYTTTLGLSINLPSCGVYILAIATLNSPLPTFYNRTTALLAGVQTALSFANGLVLNVTAQTTTSVTVTYSSATSYSAPKGYVSLNAYFTVELSAQSTIQSTIQYSFTAAQLAAANVKNAASLVLGFYDTAAGQWNFALGSQVNTNAMVVSTTTTHFSTWGVYSSATLNTASTVSGSTPITTVCFLYMLVLLAL